MRKHHRPATPAKLKRVVRVGTNLSNEQRAQLRELNELRARRNAEREAERKNPRRRLYRQHVMRTPEQREAIVRVVSRLGRRRASCPPTQVKTLNTVAALRCGTRQREHKPAPTRSRATRRPKRNTSRRQRSSAPGEPPALAGRPYHSGRARRRSA